VFSLNIQRISSVKSRRIALLGHVMRMDDKRTLKSIFSLFIPAVLKVDLIVTFMYINSQTQPYIQVLATSSFHYLLLFRFSFFDHMFRHIHSGHLQVYNCTKTTTVRNAYCGTFCCIVS
jgi:hypothetical protein